MTSSITMAEPNAICAFRFSSDLEFVAGPGD